jgi:hypothetical protein
VKTRSADNQKISLSTVRHLERKWNLQRFLGANLHRIFQRCGSKNVIEAVNCHNFHVSFIYDSFELKKMFV